MVNQQKPKIKNVNKYKSPYPLNKFPDHFAKLIGKEIIYILATKSRPALQGEEWEEIFARCIGAEWKPSNVGLDDIIHGSCAWGAKSVKCHSISSQNTVRLISGRNSIVYSYDKKLDTNANPSEVGKQVLGIWNERVSSLETKYREIRTIVLLKSNNLTELGVFEFATEKYNPSNFNWQWNDNKNLVGFETNSETHKFTWQPHGSQFTIIEPIPDDMLIISIKKPPELSRDIIFKSMNYSDDWITFKRRNGG